MLITEGVIDLNQNIAPFHTAIATGQYSYITPEDPHRYSVCRYLQQMRPLYFRSHNQYNDEYADQTGDDDFQIVEPYPPDHEHYRWDFRQLDQKIMAELEYCDRDTFIYNIRTCPVWMLDQTKAARLFPRSSGEVRDKTYRQLADYCARIVSWYNKGGFVDEKGVYHHSGHFLKIRYWEILNEQDEAESAIHIKTGQAYAEAYDAIVRAIKAVDPEVLCGGPSLSCVPTEKHDLTYLREFLENATEKIDFLSIHYYSDQSGLLSPDGVRRLQKNLQGKPDEAHFLESIDDISRYFQACVNLAARHGGMPVFVSETNVCLSDHFDQPLAPGEFSQGTFGTAWLGYLFTKASLAGIRLLQQYQFYSPLNRSRHLQNSLSLINNRTGEPHMTYWLINAINAYFPESGDIVDNDFTGDIEALAVHDPKSRHLVLLLVNKSIPEKSEDRFAGRDRKIGITFKGDQRQIKPIKMVVLDRVNPGNHQAPGHTDCKAEGNRLEIILHGYGAALLDLELSADAPEPTCVHLTNRIT